MGKVHGGIARSGKVRGQTPNVEKTEKHKKPKGRAAKRAQYNKRFIELPAVQGRRKIGPNSQQLQQVARDRQATMGV